jgi:hypothetical protein
MAVTTLSSQIFQYREDTATPPITTVVASTPRYVTYTMSGTINGARAGNVRYYPPAAMTIVTVSATVGTAVSNANLVFAISKNGVLLSPNYMINTNSYTMTSNVGANIALRTIDYLTISVNSGTASDLRVSLQYTS